jgi:ribosomal protein L24
MAKFKVGDKVKVKEGWMKGYKGKVCELNDALTVFVEFTGYVTQKHDINNLKKL